MIDTYFLITVSEAGQEVTYGPYALYNEAVLVFMNLENILKTHTYKFTNYSARIDECIIQDNAFALINTRIKETYDDKSEQ